MLNIKANNPSLKSWVPVPENSDFPIQNLPFGVFSINEEYPRVGVAIGDKILDLKAIFELGHLSDLPFKASDFDSEYLNSMMMQGKEGTRALRNRISELLDAENTELQGDAEKVLFDQNEAQMHLPVMVGDYTDFYSSEQH
ncbi:MAG: fumarylacetoacetase, partial [Flavobacteriales bacterium]|nr:fumarylacetoacetase [Flavobacteriales bacterium]